MSRDEINDAPPELRKRTEQLRAFVCRVPCPRCKRPTPVIAGATVRRDDGSCYQLNAVEARLAVVEHVDLDALLACELVEKRRQQTLWQESDDPMTTLEVCRNCGANVNTMFSEVQTVLERAIERGLFDSREALFAIFSRTRKVPNR